MDPTIGEVLTIDQLSGGLAGARHVAAIVSTRLSFEKLTVVQRRLVRVENIRRDSASVVLTNARFNHARFSTILMASQGMKKQAITVSFHKPIPQ